jgi:hypothetical protein
VYGPLERRVYLQLLRLVCEAGYSVLSKQAFYRLGEDGKIGYRDELRILDINFYLLAQTASRYFRPSNVQYLISIVSRTGSLDSSGGTVTRLRAGNTKNRGLIACNTNNLCPLHSFQIGFGANPGTCSIGAVGSLPEIKQPERTADHSPRLELILKNELSCTSSSS